MEEVRTQLVLSWEDALLAVIAGIGIYLAVVVVTRLFGQRSLSIVSTFDYPVTVAVGAIVGRTALVHTSLLGGVIALVTLFGIQSVVAWLRNNTRLGTLVDNAPILLVRDGRILGDNLRRAHVSEEDLIDDLRSSGVASIDTVAAVVLERSGRVSVIQGDRVDPTLLRNVSGKDAEPG